MDRRTFLLSAPAAALATARLVSSSEQTGKKGVMLMNRIAPSMSELHVANIDGSNERRLLADTRFEYNGSFALRGDWVVFTSERNGDGQSDIFRARLNGSGITPLVTGASMDDAAVLSPDGRSLAFVSTRNGYRANIWLLDLRDGRTRQLTGLGDVRGEDGKPDTYFRPAWAPDVRWISFSSDRNTAWTGHDDGHGWEHTQELSIYVVRPDGTGFRPGRLQARLLPGLTQLIAGRAPHCLLRDDRGSDLGRAKTELRRQGILADLSVDVVSGARFEHTSGTALELHPQFLTSNEIGYLVKYGPDEGLAYTSDRPALKRTFIRAPHWSPGGKSIMYEKVGFRPVRPLFKPLYSWDKDWDYKHIDVFPQMSRDGWIVYTEKQLGNSSVFIMRPDGSERRKVFESAGRGLDDRKVQMGLAGAFQPTWSPDGQWIAFGLGYWFFERRTMTAALWRVRRDGTEAEQLTDGSIHSGFPSYSADGTELVYRVWSDKEKGLRILNAETRHTRILTQGYDNLPGWSPDGNRIVFTRKRAEDGNFDIYTIRPDGSGLFRATEHGSSDGHAVWTADGRIMWSGSQHGFRDEAPLYDQTFQQYGQIYIMNAYGSEKRLLTDSKWEDSMPLYIPASMLGSGR